MLTAKTDIQCSVLSLRPRRPHCYQINIERQTHPSRFHMSPRPLCIAKLLELENHQRASESKGGGFAGLQCVAICTAKMVCDLRKWARRSSRLVRRKRGNCQRLGRVSRGPFVCRTWPTRNNALVGSRGGRRSTRSWYAGVYEE